MSQEDETKYVLVDASPKGYCHQRIHVSRELIEEFMKEPKMETCTCKWTVEEAGRMLFVNPDCPIHGEKKDEQ